MASGYPGTIDSLVKTFVDATSQSVVHAAHHDDLADAVMKIETELGTLPKGSYGNVRDAIAARMVAPSSPTTNDVVYYTGSVFSAGKIVDAMIASTAGIGVSKLASGGPGNEGKFLGVSGGVVQWLVAPSGGGGGGVPAALTGWFDVVGSYSVTRYTSKSLASAGTALDTGAQNAINAAQSAGGGVVYFPPGFYRLTGGLAVTSDRVKILGCGPDTSVIVTDDVVNGGGYAMRFEGPGTVSTTNITANANKGQRVVTVTSTTGIAVNDWVYLSDNWTISSVSTFQQRFIVRVAEVISSTQLRLEESLPATYHSANGGTVVKLSVLLDVGAENIGFVNATSPGRPANRANMVRFTDCINPKLINCRVDGTYNTGAWFDRCRDILVERCLFDHIIDVTGTSSSSALCLAIDECNNFRIANNVFRRVGQAVVGSFGTHSGVVVGNDIGGAAQYPGTTAATPTDSGGRGVKFFGGSNITVTGNLVHDFPFHMVRISDCHDCVVSANEIWNSIDTSGGSAGIVFDGNSGGNEGGRNYNNVAIGNSLRDIDGIGIWFSGGSSTYGASNKAIGNTMRNMLRAAPSASLGAIYIDEAGDQIIGNTITGYNTGNDGIRIQSGGACLITGNRIRNGGSGAAIRTVVGVNRIGTNDTVGETLALTTGGSADLILPLTAATSTNPTTM